MHTLFYIQLGSKLLSRIESTPVWFSMHDLDQSMLMVYGTRSAAQQDADRIPGAVVRDISLTAVSSDKARYYIIGDDEGNTID